MSKCTCIESNSEAMFYVLLPFTPLYPYALTFCCVELSTCPFYCGMRITQ